MPSTSHITQLPAQTTVVGLSWFDWLFYIFSYLCGAENGVFLGPGTSHDFSHFKLMYTAFSIYELSPQATDHLRKPRDACTTLNSYNEQTKLRKVRIWTAGYNLYTLYRVHMALTLDILEMNPQTCAPGYGIHHTVALSIKSNKTSRSIIRNWLQFSPPPCPPTDKNVRDVTCNRPLPSQKKKSNQF
jgi:hypothetical protein